MAGFFIASQSSGLASTWAGGLYRDACDALPPQQASLCSCGCWGSHGTPPLGRSWSVVGLQIGYGLGMVGWQKAASLARRVSLEESSRRWNIDIDIC